MLCCGYTLTDFPISIRLTSLALWQSNDCPSASKATLMNMDKYFMWIHYERLHNHNKAKHNKTVCIFLGIYCNHYGDLTPSPPAPRPKLTRCNLYHSPSEFHTMPQISLHEIIMIHIMTIWYYSTLQMTCKMGSCKSFCSGGYLRWEFLVYLRLPLRRYHAIILRKECMLTTVWHRKPWLQTVVNFHNIFTSLKRRCRN